MLTSYYYYNKLSHDFSNFDALMEDFMTKNGLSYLLNLLGVSPTKMGNFLNIDRTLVSKWKNGSRHLSTNSSYIENVIEFLIQRNAELNSNILENLFLSIYPNENNKTNNDDYLRKCINNFILTNENYNPSLNFSNSIKPEYSTYTSTMHVYNDEKNEILALLDMLDLALAEGVKQKLIFILSKSFDPLIESNTYRPIFIEKILTLLDIGCTLDFVHSNMNSSKIFLYCYDIISHKNTTTSSFIDTFESPYIYSIFIFEKKRMYLSMRNQNNNNSEIYGAMFLDPITINFYTGIANNILEKSYPTLSLIDITDMIDICIKNMYLNNYTEYPEVIKKNNTCYFFSPYPIINFMSDDLYYEILKNSLESNEVIEKYMNIFKEFKNNIPFELTHVDKINFYSIDYLVKLSKQDEVIYSYNQTKLTPTLKLTKNLFKKHMSELADYLIKTKNFNICLSTDLITSPNLNASYWCKKNEFLFLFDNDLSNVRICNDVHFINSISYLLNQKYLQTPDTLKNKKIVSEFLKSL
jgi:hypothetical protein